MLVEKNPVSLNSLWLWRGNTWVEVPARNLTFAGALEAAGIVGSVGEGQRAIKNGAVRTRETFWDAYTRITDPRERLLLGLPVCLLLGKNAWRLENNPETGPGQPPFVQRPGYAEVMVPCHFKTEDDEWTQEAEHEAGYWRI